MIDDWVRASPNQQVIRAVPGLLWSKEGPQVNWRQGHGCPRLTDVCREQGEAYVVQSHWRTTTKFNTSHDQQVSEDWLCGHKLVRVIMLVLMLWLSKYSTSEFWYSNFTILLFSLHGIFKLLLGYFFERVLNASHPWPCLSLISLRLQKAAKELLNPPYIIRNNQTKEQNPIIF